MRTIVTTVLAGTALAVSAVAPVMAMPVQQNLGGAAELTLVSGGCGPYGHRGPWGGCRPGGGWGGPGWGWHRHWGGGGYYHPGWHRWHRW